MKKFSELSNQEIYSLTEKEWNSIPPEEKRSCSDCKFMDSAVSWWCMNKKAIKARGTSIPGCIKCPFWDLKKSKTKKVSFFKKLISKIKTL